ncbi:MAG: fumarate hydratase, partial [Desulfatiglandaceae bacterium]
MTEFLYQDPFPPGDDTTEYRLLTKDYISTGSFADKQITIIDPEGLTLLAEAAFRDVSHLFRTSHLKQLQKILDDPSASDNDRYVALEMLKNAVIAAEGTFPSCQDTGTAVVIGKKGQRVWTGSLD